MDSFPAWFWWIVLVVSVGAFVLTVADKVRARRGMTRVRERTLLMCALLGGSPGLLLGMVIARHKVRKASFLAKFWLVLFIQLGAAFAVLYVL